MESKLPDDRPPAARAIASSAFDFARDNDCKLRELTMLEMLSRF